MISVCRPDHSYYGDMYSIPLAVIQWGNLQSLNLYHTQPVEIINQRIWSDKSHIVRSGTYNNTSKVYIADTCHSYHTGQIPL